LESTKGIEIKLMEVSLRKCSV